MREIKFRYRLEEYSTGKIITDYFDLDDYGIRFFDRNKWKILSRDEFTGLKDCKGNQIYEGDIVKYKVRNSIKRASVAWATCGFWIVGELYKLRDPQYWHIEVIGNIYEGLDQKECEGPHGL